MNNEPSNELKLERVKIITGLLKEDAEKFRKAATETGGRAKDYNRGYAKALEDAVIYLESINQADKNEA